MDCKSLAQIFAGEREEDLTDSESRAFEEHLDRCAECRERLAQAEDELAPLVAEWEPADPGQDAWERVGAAIRAELDRPQLVVTPPTVTRPRNVPALLAMAAALLLGVGLGLAFLLGDSQPSTDSDLVNKMSEALEPGREAKAPQARIEKVAIAPPAAELLEFDVGEGFEVEERVIDSDLLCIVIREKETR